MTGARFHRRGILPARARFDFRDFGRAFPNRIEVGRFEIALDDDVAGRLGVYLGCAIFERGARIDHRRRLVDDELDQLGDVFGCFLAYPHHGGDRLADEAHDAVGEDRLADRPVIEFMQHRRDFLHAPEIGGGDHHRALRRGDPRDLARRDRATHEAYPMRCGEIGGKAALAGNQRRIFQPPDGAADPFQSAAFGVRRHEVECSIERRTTARTRSRR